MLYGNLTGKDIKATIPINKFTTIMGIAGKSWSASKTLETLMLYNVALRLGLNLSSIAANLVGSQSNVDFLASAKLIFDPSNLWQGRAAVIQRDPKLKKMINFFDIYVDDKKMHDLTAKVKADTNQYSPAELILAPQRKTDELSQETIAAASLFSFMPYEKIENAKDDIAVKYLKASLGIIAKDNDTEDALDLLEFFKKCKLAHVFKGPDGKGKVVQDLLT